MFFLDVYQGGKKHKPYREISMYNQGQETELSKIYPHVDTELTPASLQSYYWV